MLNAESKANRPSPRSGCDSCLQRRGNLCVAIADYDQSGRAALEGAHGRTRVYNAGDVIYAQGDASDHVYNLLSGWVAIHRDMEDGRRQVLEFLLPGALFGLGPSWLPIGHGATCVTNASVCPIPTKNMDELRAEAPALNEQYIRLLQLHSSQMFETITTIGQGSAKERIGRLLSDLCVIAAGTRELVAGALFKVPLTQRLIAEATGLTSIHVNRVLRQLREDLVVELQNGMLRLLDPDKLRDFGEPGDDVALSPRGGFPPPPSSSPRTERALAFGR